MWVVFSLLSAFSESFKDIFGKLGSIKTDEYTSAFALHLVNLILSIPLLLITGIPLVQTQFFYGALAFLFITPLWSILYMKALKIAPLSETLPMMAFNPIFTALLSFLFQGQPITYVGWLGVIFISLGIYCVHLSKVVLESGIFQPLIRAFSNRGSQYMLAVALIWSFGAYFSKMMVAGSSPMFSTFYGGVNGVVTTTVVALIFGKKIQLKQYLQHCKNLIPIGLFYYLANLTSGIALKDGVAAYVFSIKRGSIILSSIGGKYIFHESINFTKVLGLSSILIGIVLIAI